MTRCAKLLSVSVLLAVSACSCDEPLSGDGNGDGSLPVGSNEPRVLSFLGDDPLIIYRGETYQAQFSWETTSGLAVAGEEVRFALTGSPVIGLSATSDETSQDGIAQLTLTAGDVDGSATLTAEATNIDGNKTLIAIPVSVQEDPLSNLSVRVQSQSRIPVTNAELKVYASANPPTCATLLGGSTATALQTRNYASIPSTQTIAGLTSGFKASIIAFGKTAQGNVVAQGCATVDRLNGGETTSITITVGQKDTNLDGDYDVLQHVALGDALPEPYDTVLDIVTAAVANPAGLAMYYALRQVDRTSGVTTFMDVPGQAGVEATYRQVEQNPSGYGTWNAGQQQLDIILANNLGQAYEDTTDIGAGIRDVVSDFDVGVMVTLEKDTDGSYNVEERWVDAVLTWPYGCPDGDMACTRRPLSLVDNNLAPLAEVYTANAERAPTTGTGGESERWAFESSLHGIQIRYGAFIVAVLNQVVLPSLPANVRGDSIGDVLYRDTSEPGDGGLVDCASLASAVDDGGVIGFFIDAACTTGLALAGQEIENLLVSLDVDAQNPALGQGLASGGTFVLVDKDHDLVGDTVTDWIFQAGWNAPGNPQQSQDLSSPIYGAGRRQLVACESDAVCGSGMSCQARGSYMLVADVEMGCMKNVGSKAGGAACTSDAQCGSNACEPIGAGGSLACYEACADSEQCGASESCGIASTINLNPVLNGLGSVGIQGCIHD